MADSQLAAGSLEGLGDVAAAVVGHDAVDLHAQAGVVADRFTQELGAARALLVIQDASEGHAGVVVNGQVHGVPADASVAMLALPGDAVAHTLDAAKALGVDVQQFAGIGALVAAHRLGRLQARQPTQAQTGHVASHGGQTAPGLPGDSPEGQPLAAQLLEAKHLIGRASLGAASRPRAAIAQSSLPSALKRASHLKTVRQLTRVGLRWAWL